VARHFGWLLASCLALPGLAAAQDPRWFEAQELIAAERIDEAGAIADTLEAEAADDAARLDAAELRATLDFMLADADVALASLEAVDAGLVTGRGWEDARRLPVLDMLALLHEEAGDADAARMTYLRLAHVALVAGDGATQAIAQEALARDALVRGAGREAVLFATDLHEAALLVGDSALAASALGLRAQGHLVLDDPAQAQVVLALAGLDTSAVAEARSALDARARAMGDVPAARAGWRAAAEGLIVDPRATRIQPAQQALFTALDAGDLDAAQEAAERVLAEVEPEGAARASLCNLMVLVLAEADAAHRQRWLDCTLEYPDALLAVRADLVPALESHAAAVAEQGDVSAALEIIERTVAISLLQRGEGSLPVARQLFRRAELLFYLRRLEDTQADIDRALAATEPLDPTLRFDLLSLRGALQLARQDAPGADAAYRAAADTLRAAGLTGDARWAYLLSSMAEVQIRLGTLDQAEVLARQALETALSLDAMTQMQMRVALGAVLSKQGRAADALAALEASEGVAAEMLAADKGVAVTWLLGYATVLRNAGRNEEAEEVMARAQPILRDHPELVEDPGLAVPILTALVNDALAAQDLARAEGYADSALSVLPKGDPQRLDMLEVKGRVAIWQDRDAEALALFREVGAARLQPGRDTLAGARRTLPLQVEAALRMAQQTEGAENLAYLDEAFRVGQTLGALSAGRAIARASARWETEPALARQVRRLQDTEARIARLTDAYGAALARGDSGEEIASTLSRSGDAHAALQAEVARDHPRYAAAVDPQAVGLAEVAGWLREEEVLVVYAASDENDGSAYLGSTVIAVTREQVLAGGTLARTELERLARDLRCQAALTDRACAEARANGRAGTRGAFVLDPDEEEEGVTDGFDLALAHEAYAALLGPVEPLLAGRKRLIVVPDPSLVALPFHMLVRDAPHPETTLRDAPWLLRDMSIFVVPTVASLDALRRRAPARAQGGFLGIGDPLIGAQTGGALPYDCGAVTQELAALDPEAGPVMRGGLADPGSLRRLAALPDTRCELRAAAAFFGADSRLLLQGDATETRIRALDALGTLARYRTISFATHGLIAGEVGDFDAGIVLTPPDIASATDDGILTTGDIAQLTLDADMVLLSACNTAAGAAGSKEGLSGLASAFFYAGARSILVSHWPVYSDAATALTTRMLARRAGDDTLGYADALRLVMLDILDDPASDARALHPAYWAPFMVVGEGAGR
jgi:CHAT domain-containing protein